MSFLGLDLSFTLEHIMRIITFLTLSLNTQGPNLFSGITRNTA